MSLTSNGFSRRRLLTGASAGAVAALIGAPSIVRAQAKELVVGGAAGFAPWMNGSVSQAFEAKYKDRKSTRLNSSH